MCTFIILMCWFVKMPLWLSILGTVIAGIGILCKFAKFVDRVNKYGNDD